MGKPRLTAVQLDDVIRQAAQMQGLKPIEAFGRQWFRLMANPSDVKDLVAAGRITVAEDEHGKEWYLVPVGEEGDDGSSDRPGDV